MACNQTLAGLTRDCAAGMGGIVAAWIALKDDVSAVTITDGKITTITMATGTGSTVKKFHKYDFRRGTSQFTSTLNNDPAQGVSYVSTDIVLQFNKMETVKRVEMAALAVSELCVFVEDSNGAYWFFGKDEAVCATAGDGQTGTARGDANRYTITLQDNSKEFPCEMLVGTGGVDISSIADRE